MNREGLRYNWIGRISNGRASVLTRTFLSLLAVRIDSANPALLRTSITGRGSQNTSWSLWRTTLAVFVALVTVVGTTMHEYGVGGHIED